MLLETEVYLKGDYIVHKGVPGKEMYLISKGKCEITNNFIHKGRVQDHGPKSNAESAESVAVENPMVSASTKKEKIGEQSRFAPLKLHKKAFSESFRAKLPLISISEGSRMSWGKSTSPRDRKLSSLYKRNEEAKTPAKTPSTTRKITPEENLKGKSPIPDDKFPTNSEMNKKLPGVDNSHQTSKISSERSSQPLIAVEKVLRVLPRGSHFGELALVTNAKRGCNVRASSFCEIQVLTRTVFDSVMEHYPEEKRLIKALLLQKCSQEEAKHADVRMSNEEKNIKPEENIKDFSTRLESLERVLVGLVETQEKGRN